MGLVDIILIAICLFIDFFLFYKSFIKKSGSCGSCSQQKSCPKSLLYKKNNPNNQQETAAKIDKLKEIKDT